ncbi:flagellin C [Bosea caraganae]|uniref:Flagellin n=1 Tax=Bosea caraganae TaxID=2763117 RepID=A0A370LC51_9HYPH|nr:flagellin [Bosea caraganae]RDJ27413.1 flagellin C [Bosea caraganae]RDJ29429.1 flagellin C [Bosea caraganae]
MASLLTNSSAMTALQTLSMTNKNLATTQSRISTGQRVATASDNAAYWSIATTMRSDNKALGAVQDALGLGAATIDTMYTGLSATDDIMSDLKAKLVTARTPGVDRAKVQSDIDNMLSDLKSSADSSVFNSENWLSVNSADPDYNAVKSVVSSFSRAGGVVSIDTVDVDLDSIKLYDATPDTAYKAAAVDSDAVAFDPSAIGSAGPPPVTTSTIFFVAINLEGKVVLNAELEVTKDKTTLEDIAKWVNDQNLDGFTGAINASQDGLVFRNRGANDVAFGGAADNGLGTYGLYFDPFTAETEKGILDKTYDVYRAGAWEEFSVSSIDISELTDSVGDLQTLETYIKAVDGASKELADAATNLGAIKNRVDRQQDFVKSMVDSIDRGIGQLVDADMNAESTRLQALQVQQQLGIQALSIANGNSQSILSLFRG